MIKLEQTFISGDGGFAAEPRTYTQLARTDTVAIYERSRDGKAIDWEVFHIKILPKGTQVFQTLTEDDQERYPSNGQFGFIAWSFNDKERAMKRYEDLNNKLVATEEKPIELPAGEFTVGELATQNGATYITAATFVKEAVTAGTVKFIRSERRNAKGKPSNIYAKV